MKITKKYWNLPLSLMILVTLLSACGGGSGKSASPEAATGGSGLKKKVATDQNCKEVKVKNLKELKRLIGSEEMEKLEQECSSLQAGCIKEITESLARQNLVMHPQGLMDLASQISGRY